VQKKKKEVRKCVEDLFFQIGKVMNAFEDRIIKLEKAWAMLVAKMASDKAKECKSKREKVGCSMTKEERKVRKLYK
jgi:hypothetical protein